MQVSRSGPNQPAHVRLSAPRVGMLFILLLALGLRLFHLGSMSLWWDESLSYDRAVHDLPTILSNVIQIQDVVTRDLHPPGYFVLLHFAVLAFGLTEFALRFLSTFVNVLTVALLYPVVVLLARLGRRREGVRPALLTAFFAAFSPFYVWYSQEARPYALVLFWSLLAVYALLKMIEESRRTRALARIYPYAFLYFFSLAATFSTHYLSFLLLPFHAAAVLVWGWREKRWRAMALLLGAGFVAALGLVLNSAAQATGSDMGASWVPFFIILRDVWNSFAVGVTANLDRVALLDLALVALWCLGVAATVRPRRRDYALALFMLAYLFLPAIVLQLASYIRPLYLNSRHLITISPAFYVGLALGVEALARRARGLRFPRSSYAAAGLAAGALVVVGSLHALNNLYFNPAFAKDDHRAWSEFLRERARPGDLLILNAPQAEKIYRYYAPPGLEWISLPHIGLSPAETEKRDFAAVRDAFLNHARIWYLEIHRPVGDVTNHTYNLLDRFGTWVGITRFAGTSTEIVLQEIVGEAVLDEIPPIQHPNSLQVGDSPLTLLGWDAPAQLPAGGHGAVRLYWRLNAPTAESLGVSLRVVDDAGARWGQWDAVPLGNLFPMSKWPAHKVIVETHALPIDPGTPPGRYHIEFSVYHAGTDEPLNLCTPTCNPQFSLSDLAVTRPTSPLDPRELTLDHHSNIRFGETLNFIGYDAEVSSSGPGGEIPLTLYFQVLENPGRNVTGEVQLTPPFWAFWNPAQARTPFTLALAARMPGDVVQLPLTVHVPGNAGGGDYSLKLALENQVVEFAAAQVKSIAREVSGETITHPQSARLGDGIDFIGYNLDAPRPLHGGDHVTVTLFWRTNKTVPTSFTVFTHFLDPANQIAGQHDSPPANDTRETTSWAPGEVIADAHTFEVKAGAAPGEYTLEIGMYNAADNTRLPVLNSAGGAADNRIVLGTLTVQ